jgi:hypothetical protein
MLTPDSLSHLAATRFFDHAIEGSRETRGHVLSRNIGAPSSWSAARFNDVVADLQSLDVHPREFFRVFVFSTYETKREHFLATVPG